MTSLPPQPSKPIDASPVSTRSVNIKGLLDKCLRERNCGRHRLPDYVPPRLLDCSLGCPRLVESKDIERGSNYATLSHCWGAQPPSITLTTDNFDLLHDGIRDALPATFADAVDICTRLNLRYLWIDSLCIIQSGPGHVEDWLNHVKQMVHIYGSSVVNIAAEHSKDSNGGCYSWRQPGGYHKLSSHGISVKGLPQIGPYALFSRVNKEWEPGASHLHTRGWVFQERLLSPRVLQFDEYDVIWECHEGMASGNLPDHDIFPRYGIVVFVRQPFTWNLKLNKDFDLEQLSPGEESRDYLRLQHIYSKTNLTRGEDRLAAYSSIAQLCCEATGDSYIAGYLHSELPICLLWRNNLQYGGNSQRIREPYIAPTWSWASMERGWEKPSAYSFEPLQKTLYKQFSIEQYSSELVDKTNKYGPIHSASLQVKCVLIPVQLSAQLEYFPWGGVYQMSFGSESVDLNIWWDEEGWPTSFTEVYFMPIQCPYNALVGIVLTPRVGSSPAFTSGTPKPPTYLRAGYPNVSDKDNNGPASRKVLTYLENVPSQIISLE
ncbi:Heterokaryon incompatibility protein (HET) domain containing protein [Hyaloscypha variabilis]